MVNSNRRFDIPITMPVKIKEWFVIKRVRVFLTAQLKS